MNNKKTVTVAIPCYKSSKTIEGVVDSINAAFNAQSKYDYQIVLVNDGSPDNTFEVIHRICRKNDRVIGVNLSRNYGQGSAKMAAVDYVKGDYLIYMDDDGQHPVDGIFTMVEKINEGFDIVYANFEHKKHNAFKKITSNIHNWYMSVIDSKPKNIHLSSFMGLSSFCIEALQTSGCPVVAMGSYLRKLTKRIVNVDMPHLERKAGKSGYSIRRLFKLWRSSITSFNTQLLNYSMTVGVIVGSVGILSAIAIIIKKLLNPHVAIGYASLMAGMLILSALIMFFISIASDYIGKIYLILCKLPAYKVREVIDKKSIEECNVVQKEIVNQLSDDSNK